jgi:uncharacterized protein YfaS (alpha-2-macroglobulin family)
MRWLVKSQARNVMVFMADETDGETGETGLTLTLELSKAGGDFAAMTATVTERGNGWYSVATTTSHTDTLGDWVMRATATGAKNAEVVCQVMPSYLFTGAY